MDPVVMQLYTVYLNPVDLDVAGYAVREFRISKGKVDPGRLLAQGLDSLEEARKVVPPVADVCFARDHNDDPAIVESWI